MSRLLLAVAALLLLAASPAEAKKLEVTPAATVTTANVELRGGGFRAARTVVRIGGKRARVTRGSRTLLRVDLPALAPGRHRVVAGGRRGRIRIVRPFGGRVTIKADERRSRGRTIGPAGGRISARSANGTRLTLTVPGGALGAPTEIRLAPARVSGLPVTGRRSVAAHFEPEGLRFARPARLTMKLDRRPRGRFVGFSAAGDGTGLGFSRATRKGRTLAIDVHHFSAGGAASAIPQDVLILLQGVVESDFPLPVSRIELLREQVGVWSEIWGEDVCVELCSNLQDLVRVSLAFHIDDACDAGRASPSPAAFSRIVRLEALNQEFGGNDPAGIDCAQEILSVLVDRAIARSIPDPLVEAEPGELPPDAGGMQLDDRERVTAFEWLVFLSVLAQEAGDDQQRDRLDAAIDSGWGRIVALNEPGCDTDDRQRSTANLEVGWDYASRLVQATELMRGALDHCRLEVDMAPIAPLAPGETRTLQPRVHHLVDPSVNNGVTWSATGGTITPDGVYTAPDMPGSYEITLKSAHNPQRVWKAPVTVSCAPSVSAQTMKAASLQAEPDTCAAPAVAIDERYSELAVDVWTLSEVTKEHAALGTWTDSLASSHDDNGSVSSASAMQTSDAKVAGALFTASADLAVHTSVSGADGSAAAEALHRVDFTVGEEGAGYRLQGAHQVPPGAGISGVALDRLGPVPERVFITDAASLDESGTLEPGQYRIWFEVSLHAGGLEAWDGSLDATFTVE